MLNAIKKAAPMGFSPATVMLAVSLFTGCITSPVWEYGATKQAGETKLAPCPNGLLDDGEDGNTQIITEGGRDGYWFSFADPWGTTMAPKRFAFTQGGPAETGGRLTARIHGKLTDSGDSIYAGLGFAFTNPKSPFDISHAKGIRFWAKGPGRIRFKMPDRNTDPVGDRCSDCYNDFGVDIYLQDEWMRYTIPFDQMAQQPGWGDRAPELDAEGAFAVQWQVYTAGADYDISVDNIELVGCTPREVR